MSNALGRASLMLTDHSLIEEFYKMVHINYEKDTFLTYNFKMMMGNGVFLLENARWKLHRRILSEAFEFTNLRKMQPIIKEAILDHFTEMEREGRMSNVHILQEFQKITGDIVLKTFFGSDFSKRKINGKTVTQYLSDLGEAMNLQLVRNPLTFFFGPQILKLNLTQNDRRVSRETEELRVIAREVINQRRHEQQTAYTKDEARKDFLDFLLEHNSRNPEDQLSDAEIIDNMITLFTGGMDTTAHLLTTSMYYLLKYPETAAKIMNEAKSNGINFDHITIDGLASLKYLDAFLKEVLRNSAPILSLLPRRAKTTHKLGDLTILKGTIVNVSFNVAGFNETFYDQPYEFRPERFLEENVQRKTRYPYSFLYFSAGARNCIGKYLAFIEAKTILLTFLKRYSFKFSNPDYKLKFGIRFLYEPVDPILLDLVKQ
eukprot:TRINITY_DN3722_c0_g1_i3.p1 TRINITY_DN3722_c0_g1~~TRINITY_DN3722_c0_g1_i3.p1  ORF type:complete len:431 (+),score=76.41 TRINITY_DN3722_c0_g1_i3:320-1612(+)